jgi:hypothetical protein
MRAKLAAIGVQVSDTKLGSERLDFPNNVVERWFPSPYPVSR